MEIIRIGRDEHSLIQDFIEKYWKSGHSLVKSKSLLDFQHLMGEYYCFYAAVENNQIWSLQGFIPTSQFDLSLSDNCDVWGAIWKTRDDSPDKMIGLSLLETIEKEFGKGSVGAIGISPIAKKIYRLLSWETGYLRHYYILNEKIDDFTILKTNTKPTYIKHPVSNDWHIKISYSLNDCEEPAEIYKPQKSIKFFINRYERHPIYKYSFWCFYQGDILKSIWAVRRITVNKNSVFRVVDVLGRIEEFPDLYNPIQDVLQTESVEYLDLLNYGIAPDVFKTIGFSELDFESTDTIIPNYFEPFEQKNVKIEVAFKSDSEYVCFKGDSDQDRPNIL